MHYHSCLSTTHFQPQNAEFVGFFVVLSIRIPEDFITDFSSVVFGSRYVEFTASKFKPVFVYSHKGTELPLP